MFAWATPALRALPGMTVTLTEGVPSRDPSPRVKDPASPREASLSLLLSLCNGGSRGPFPPGLLSTLRHTTGPQGAPLSEGSPQATLSSPGQDTLKATSQTLHEDDAGAPSKDRTLRCWQRGSPVQVSSDCGKAVKAFFTTGLTPGPHGPHTILGDTEDGEGK